MSFACMQKSEFKVATLNCLGFDGINAASNEIYIYIFILARISRTIRLYKRDRECVTVCVVAKYFGCCSVLCALRIRCMLYVVLFFFQLKLFSCKTRCICGSSKRPNQEYVYVYAQERFEFKVVASLQLISWWSSHTHTHAHAYIMWKAVVVYVSNGILIFFLYRENKTRIHVCCC